MLSLDPHLSPSTLGVISPLHLAAYLLTEDCGVLFSKLALCEVSPRALVPSGDLCVLNQKLWFYQSRKAF